MALTDRFKHAWNAFMNRDPPMQNYGYSSSLRPDRIRLTRGNERSIVTSIINRFAIDCSSIDIRHVRLDKAKRYTEDIEDSFNDCLTLEANKDETGRKFIQDIVMSMLDEGTCCAVPVDTDIDINNVNVFKILTMRVGKITQWYPDHVKVDLYNDRTGRHEERIFKKSNVCIFENPFFAVMNEPNSTLQRLSRKLSLLDVVDEESGAGKLDLIIQLPYVVKSEARKQQAEQRRKDIEMQLSGSKYGIAYTDGTEKITQLNRSLENHLLDQVEYLTSMLFSQLGITKEIMDGTADENAMTNYYSRTIEPILTTIVEEMRRKFLSPTARTQGQSVMFFRNYFKLIPVSQMADMSDKLTRNEILSSNEMRQNLGYKPVDDPQADQLKNKNINAQDDQTFATTNDEVGGGTESADLGDFGKTPISQLNN